MTQPDRSANFRREATRLFHAVYVALLLVFAGIVALGWWLAGWWGLAGGVVVGSLVLVVGHFGSVFLYAMSQDSR